MLSGSMIDRPTFSIIDKESGKYIINPGVVAPEPNRFYLSPHSALRDFYVNLNSTLCKILHEYSIHGYLSDKRKALFKKMSRSIAVKNDITHETNGSDFVSTNIRMTLKSWLIEDSPRVHPIIVEDYVDGDQLDEVYATIIVNRKSGEIPPHKIINVTDRDLNNSKLSRLIGTYDRAIISSKFKDEDDLVMWKLNQTKLIDEIRIEDLDKSIEAIKTVEEDFGISFKEP